MKDLQTMNLFYAATEGPPLATEQDALDLLGETYGIETVAIIVPANRFALGFFDLSTRQAGLFFQKMQNYHARLVVLGDISAHIARSRALDDFVRETNRIGQHIFASDLAEMEMRLGRPLK